MTILAHQLVDEVIRRWPATIPVFVRHGMDCLGCPAAPYHTVEEACAKHQVPLRTLLLALQAVTNGRARE